MNNNFEELKQQTKELIENNLSNNEKAILNFINTLLNSFGSKLQVRKNISIASFKHLLLNSATVEDFTQYLQKLDSNKEYEIEDAEGIKESYEFNEKYTKEYEKDYNAYEQYKKFLDGRIKLNDNLYVMEYI